MTHTFFRLIISVFIMSNSICANAQIITTVAGSGPAGPGTGSYSGDGGAATTATLNTANGVAFDGMGNMVIADQRNHVIRKVDASGIITTIAGTGTAGHAGDGGPASSATLYYPFCIVIDGSGNIFFSEGSNNDIRKINTAGIITTYVGTAYAGTGVRGYAGDGGPATAAKLDGPLGLTIDASGNLLFTDVRNNVIRKVDGAGIITTIVGDGYGSGSGGAFGGYSGDGGPATAARLFHPNDVKMDGAGNLFITDEQNRVVRKVNTSGIISTYAGTGVLGSGGDGGPASAAQFQFPAFLAIDCSGNLFISDNSTTRVRMVRSSTGIIKKIAGTTYGFSGDGGAATSAKLGAPLCLTFDPSGNLYVADYDNNRIRMISANFASVITGALFVCTGYTTTLSCLTPGGTWSSSAPGVATVGSSSGIVTGISAGSAIISYTVPGADICPVTVVVDASPTISGPNHVCVGANMTLTSGPGVWSSSPVSIASVGSSSGVVTGVSTGVATITYTSSSGCTNNVMVTVEANPAITGVLNACVGATTTLNATPAGGTWSGAPISVATIGSLTGEVTGVSPGIVNVTYTALGCPAVVAVTVSPSPSLHNVTGGGFVCMGSIPIGLSGSDVGIDYQLYNGIAVVGSPVAGTGTSLNFGLFSATGTYTVLATDAVTGCTSTMSGSAILTTLTSASVNQTSPIAMPPGGAAYTYYAGTPAFALKVITVPAVIPGGTYSWTDGTTTYSSSLPDYSPVFTPVSTLVIHNYTVTVTVGTCSVTTTVDVVVPPVDCSPYNFFEVNAYRSYDGATPAVVPSCIDCSDIQPFETITSSSLVSGGNILPNKNYYIVNSATLSGGTYNDDLFFMNGGVSLDLGLNSATINHCHFSSSPDCMWRGINVNVTSAATGPGAGAGSLTIQNSLIEHAGEGSTAGININTVGPIADGGYYTTSGMPKILKSDGTVYNSNFCGIHINGYAPSTAPTGPAGPTTTLPFEITNSVFTHRDFAQVPVGMLGLVSAANYPFSWPSAFTDLKPFTPDPADPSFLIDNYGLRLYESTSPEGHVGIYMGNSGYSQPVTSGYDYNYLQVGDPAGDATFAKTNLFDNMYFGSQVQNSNALFNNNTFRHVHQGIYISNQYNDVKIAGDPVLAPNSINRFYTNYQIGVHVESNVLTFMIMPNDLTCSNALFTSAPLLSGGANTAIDMYFLSPASMPAHHNKFDINHNTIYNYSQGINIYHQTGSTTSTAFSSTTNINDNTITGDLLAGAGVYHAIDYSDIRICTGCPANGDVHIDRNTINGVQNGIQANSLTENVYVNENLVEIADYSSSTYPPSGMTWCIYVNSSPYLMEVQDNIAGAWGYSCFSSNPSVPGSAYHTVGILTDDGIGRASTHADMSCNAVHDMVRGFNFQLTNHVDWHDNEMLNNTYGMYLDGGVASIGQQGGPGTPSDNHWETTTVCTFCSTGGCATSWPGWSAAAGTYQTYVYAGSSAASSPIYYRTATPGYDITENGSQTPAFPYGASELIPTTGTGPSNCRTETAFRQSPGPETEGVAEVQEYNLYPNPSTGTVTITRTVNTNTLVHVVVLNVLGQKVYSDDLQFSGGKAWFSLKDVAPGIYQVTLRDAKGAAWNRKVIIEK